MLLIPDFGGDADPFDPRSWTELAPDAPVKLSLSNRWDIYCWLDYEDWVWARELPWCHTYGAGPMRFDLLAGWVISRPDCIYARRSVPIPGRLTPTGRPAYGSEFLHRRILKLKTGRNPLSKIGDHRDGNTLNNRRRNLRWATKSQNAMNTPSSRYRARIQRQFEQEAEDVTTQAACAVLPDEYDAQGSFCVGVDDGAQDRRDRASRSSLPSV